MFDKLREKYEMKNEEIIKSNIKDTALILEGGGMRASYTAGFVTTLLENDIYFDYVTGISAGSSHTVNYISRDIERTKRSFVDTVLDPNFGGWKYFLKGEGFFRAEYIYEQTPYPDAALPFDFEMFKKNTARLRIGAFNRELGKMEYFKKEDIQELTDLMKIVRASSSMPFFMPPTEYNGNIYIDGGISGGIPLDIAKEDGFDKYFVVLTREKGYRKKPIKFKGLIKSFYRKYPEVIEAMLTRHIHYNRTLEELEQLEREGKAYIVYPKTMPITNKETNHERLAKCYQLGYRQGQEELPFWKEFLLPTFTKGNRR